MADYLLEVEDLRTYFFTKRGVVKAVDGVSFRIGNGETLGLVGESGCGKTVTALSVIRLVSQPAGRIVGGRVLLEGEDLVTRSESEMSRIRGRRISMVLQDPLSSLNPVLTVGQQVAEPIRIHHKRPTSEAWQKAKRMLELVRIPSPQERMRQYPHQMSGGMRQRIVGAIALSCEPHLLIADEPTTSLDVTIQAQYLSLLKDLQSERSLSILFITHDFGVVARMCDRVAVMYAGKVVESAPVEEIFDHPRHPYTFALMRSLPSLKAGSRRLFSIEGQPPDLRALPPGCPFAPRCFRVRDKCLEECHEVEVGPEHRLRCWFPLEESVGD